MYVRQSGETPECRAPNKYPPALILDIQKEIKIISLNISSQIMKVLLVLLFINIIGVIITLPNNGEY